ncbi:MAG TPA: NAD(P)-dependent oxidoreductase [Thermodesulfobacteriota bacterium]
MTERVGFIGVGKMGAPMVRRLLAAGHTVHLHDVSEAALAPFRGLERVALEASAQGVASCVPVVLLSLPGPAELEAVALGPQGIVAAGAGRCVIDLSTCGVAAARRVAAALAEAGIGYVDAPVSGGPRGAERGTLAVMAAGPGDLVERYRGLLSVFGSRVFAVGTQPGQGQAMKLVNNMLSATAMAATSEAMVVAARAGLAPATALEVLNASSGMNTATRDKFPQEVVTRTFNYGFATGLMYKDVKLFEELAQSLGVPTFVGDAVAGMWRFAVDRGTAQQDITTLVRFYEQWAGVEVGGREAGTEAR